jgi:hypothetical protein
MACFKVKAVNNGLASFFGQVVQYAQDHGLRQLLQYLCNDEVRLIVQDIDYIQRRLWLYQCGQLTDMTLIVVTQWVCIR